MSFGRLYLLLAAAGYVTTLFIVYQLAIVPVYDYYGMSGRDIGTGDLVFLLGISILPATWLPVTLRRPSTLLILALYVLVFVPAVLLAYYASLPRLTLGDARLLALTLCAGLACLSLGHLLPLPVMRRPRLSPALFWGVVIGVASALYAYLLVRFGSVFKFVDLGAVDDQRLAFGSVVDMVGVYGIAWLASAFNPLLAGWGFTTRRPWVVVGAIGGQLLLYGAAGAKGYLLSVPLLLVLAYMVPRHARLMPVLAVAGAAVASATGPLLTLLGATTVGGVTTYLLSFRSACVPGLATVQYFGFFQHHPHTLGSHIRGLSSLLEYPFVLPLDRLMAWHYYQNLRSATNANLWATDAIAGFGLWAVIPVSLVCAGVFYLLDLSARGLELRLALVALGYAVVNFTNVPLGTNILTGGIGILLVLFYLMPRPAPVAGSVDVG